MSRRRSLEKFSFLTDPPGIEVVCLGSVSPWVIAFGTTSRSHFRVCLEWAQQDVALGATPKLEIARSYQHLEVLWNFARALVRTSLGNVVNFDQSPRPLSRHSKKSQLSKPFSRMMP